jgi:hypothetical protein
MCEESAGSYWKRIDRFSSPPSEESRKLIYIYSSMTKELRFTVRPRFSDHFYQLSALAASKQH